MDDDQAMASHASSPPRRASPIDTAALNSGQPHPKHVQFRREPAPHSALTARIARAFDFRRPRRSMEIEQDSDDAERNEGSPLIGPTTKALPSGGAVPPLHDADDDDDVLSPQSGQSWDDVERPGDETKSSWYLVLLTLGIFGLQIAWSVELSNGSPYLLGLGISKSLLAFVWIAGPLSGTLVQPYVGIKSDRCQSRWGKRRPFIVGGAIATIISLMALAWTRELVAAVLHIFGAAHDSSGVATTAIVFAVVTIYVLDFSINVIQAGIRAFIVDNAPTHQQDAANAWASRISGLGNILGYLSGYVDLPRHLSFFGDTQFKVLCVIASLALAVTVTISCLAIRERDPRLEGAPSAMQAGVWPFFTSLYHLIRRLPRQISRVCQVQFFAWIGWFPFLFYITTYIGQLYANPIFAANPAMAPADIDAVWQDATREGTFALLIFALTSFASSVFLPFLVACPHHAPASPLRTPMTPAALSPALTAHSPAHTCSRPSGHTMPLTPGPPSDDGYFTPSPAHPRHAQPLSSRLLARLPSPHIPALTLRRAWLLSHLLFACAMLSTFLVHNTTSATVLVALIGIPWSLTNWAPYALIAAEIRARDDRTGDGSGEKQDQAGVLLGLHNVAIASPQILATLASSAVFRALQKPRGSAGDESVAWVLRMGGVAALGAAWLTKRVGEEARG